MGRTMADAIKDLEKIYGEGNNVWSANKEILLRGEGYSTGSYVLDETISKIVWGLPKGRLVQFAGAPASGKTLLSLSCISQMHKRNPDAYALFVDAEFTFDVDWAKKLGVDTSRLLVMPENNGRTIMERLTGVPSKDIGKEKSKAGILDLEASEPSGLGLIVIDSIVSVIPTVEEVSGPGKQNMAPLARFLPPELRKITPLLAKTGVSMIIINQLRIDPGVMYGNPERSSGGNALAHASSLTVNFAQVSGKENLILNENEEAVGHRIKAKIMKNKIAPGRDRHVEFDILYEKGISGHNKEAVELGIKYNIIERPNNKTYIYNNEKFLGRKEIEDYFDDEEKIQTIIGAIKNKIEEERNG